MSNNIVITIARQYGSGGRTIGQMLSEKLGIEYYDRDLLKIASDESGISEALFAKADETFKRNPLFPIAKKVYNGELIPPDSDDFTSTQNLFNYQAKIIKELAERESCIIIGRCADFVLKDYENVVSVFVHAPQDYLVAQTKNKLNMNDKEAEKYIAKTDKYRASYYEHYTGRQWTDARNYDLCLDSSKLGYEKCLDEIIAYMTVRFGEEAMSQFHIK